MPPGIRPVEQSETDTMKQRDDKLSHIVAISMDRRGWPIGLFTTNRWVTTENWYAAADVCRMVDRFSIDLARPSWATNRWVTAMMQLFRPQIETLLHQRDAKLVAWHKTHPDADIFEDRRLDLPSQVKISLDQQIRAVDATLDSGAS